MTPVKGPNKRAKGEGTIYQRKADGLWVASIELPSPDNRRRRKVVVAKTEAQVKAKLRTVKTDLEKHGDLATGSQTLATWLTHWYEKIVLKKVRPSTAATTKGYVFNYLIPAIGKVRLDKLTPDHVRRVEDLILSKGLSSSTALKAHRILSKALKDAMREGRVTRNVATLTDAPRLARTNLTVLSPADGIKVLRTVAGDPRKGVLPDRLASRWAAALLTGARRGELLGLELDRVTDVLDLSWQLQRLSWEHGCLTPCGRKRGTDCPDRKLTSPADWEHRHLTGGLYLTRPKSNAGWRIIPLVDPLRTILEQRIDAAATEPNPHGLLWTADPKRDKQGTLLELDGSPIDPRNDSAAWHGILARAGVPDARLHDARHTTASLLLAAGVPEKVIMEIMGHNSYVVTRGYQNVDRAQLNKAMTAISALMPLTE